MTAGSERLNIYAPFQEMLQNILDLADGSSGPYIDGRVLAGELSKALGQVEKIGYTTKEPVFFDFMTLRGVLTSTNPGAFIDKCRRKFSQGQNDWTNFYKYVYWTLVTSEGRQLCDARQFASFSELAAFIAANAASSAGAYTESVYLYGYELVDGADTYPEFRRCRNSLFAAIRGRHGSIVRAADNYGVSANFNAGKFYANAGTIQTQATPVNWWNNMARNFLRHRFGIGAGSNNDGAVWATWQHRSQWSLPKVGKSVFLTGPNRGAVWDTGTSSWVVPPAVPGGHYTFEDPFILYDWQGRGVLDTTPINAPRAQYLSWNSVAVLVFPVVNGTNYAFVIYPYGADTWWTEYLDPTKYDLVVRSVFRHEHLAQYRVVPPTKHRGPTDHPVETMFNTWPSNKNGESQLFQQERWQWRQNIDNDCIPVAFDLCRRDKLTGIRSPYRSLFKVKRRFPSGSIRRDPAFL